MSASNLTPRHRPHKPASRPMATWHPEPSPVPPAGFTAPLTAQELDLLRDFRALAPSDRRLIASIVAALARE